MAAALAVAWRIAPCTSARAAHRQPDMAAPGHDQGGQLRGAAEDPRGDRRPGRSSCARRSTTRNSPASPTESRSGRLIADHGLTCESAHFGMDELRNSQAKSIAWANDVGITQMVTATLGGGRHSPTLDQVKRAADEYNRIAAVAAKAGIQQGLHNEGFELSRSTASGPTTCCSSCSIRSWSSSSSRCRRSRRASSPPSTSRSTRAASTRCTCRTWT